MSLYYLTLSESGKAVKGGRWFINEGAIAEDMNYLFEAQYKQLADLLALKAFRWINPTPPWANSVAAVVTHGFRLRAEGGTLSGYLQAGALASIEGSYLDDGVFEFNGSGDVFALINAPEAFDSSIIHDAGGASDRIDTVEVRPFWEGYKTDNRQFLDPMTGLEITQPVTTRRRIGMQSQVLKGSEGAGIAPARTSGWVKIAEVTVPASASAITQANIADFHDSAKWTTDPYVTVAIPTWMDITATMGIDLSKYPGDLHLVCNGTITVTFSNALQQGSKLFIINKGSGTVTLAGTISTTLSQGDIVVGLNTEVGATNTKMTGTIV